MRGAKKTLFYNKIFKMDTRARLRKKLEDKKARDVSPPSSIQAQLGKFPQWVTEQLVRSWPEVCHNEFPFMLLFRFDLKGLGVSESQLDILLIKVNGGIYYESSTHPDGLQARLGRDIKVTPAQLIYVHAPSGHVKDAVVELTTDISRLKYVGDSIPGTHALEGVVWDVPLNVNVHLPLIRTPPK